MALAVRKIRRRRERKDYMMNQKDEFREMETYKMACTKLRPDPKAVNRVMKRERAARQFQVKFWVDGNVLQIGAGLEKKEDQYVIHLEAEPESTVTMTEE